MHSSNAASLKLAPAMKVRRLFIDLETSPNVVYSWRAGFKINISPESIIEERAIICAGYKWQGEDEVVHCPSWTKRGDDRAVLEHIIPIMESAVEVVAHHGDKFDIPWVRARAAYHGIPMSPYIKTIDTRAQSSRNFYFNSNKLDYLAQFFGLGKKRDTDYDLWKDVMAGDADALSRMIDYCKHDVVLLEKLYLHLESYNKPKTHYGVLGRRPKWSCPRCGSESVRRIFDEVTVVGTRQARMKCRDCQSMFRINDATATTGELYTFGKKQCTKCLEWKIDDNDNFRPVKSRGNRRAECRPCGDQWKKDKPKAA